MQLASAYVALLTFPGEQQWVEVDRRRSESEKPVNSPEGSSMIARLKKAIFGY